MKTIMVILILAFCLPIQGCNPDNHIKRRTKIDAYNVTEILEMSPRAIENLNTFVIKGKLGNSVNILGLNCFILEDLKYSKYHMMVTTENITIPGLRKGDSIMLRIYLYKEIRIGKNNFLLFKEPSRK